MKITDRSDPSRERQRQLEMRLLRFASDVMDFAGTLARAPESEHLVAQMVRASASIGSSYDKANVGESRADFVNNCSTARKEAVETGHCLKLAAFRGIGDKLARDILLEECEQFVRLFGTIISGARRRH